MCLALFSVPRRQQRAEKRSCFSATYLLERGAEKKKQHVHQSGQDGQRPELRPGVQNCPPWVSPSPPPALTEDPPQSEPGGTRLDRQLEGRRPELSGFPCSPSSAQRRKGGRRFWASPLQFNFKPSRPAGGQVAQGPGPLFTLRSQRVCPLPLLSLLAPFSLSCILSFFLLSSFSSPIPSTLSLSLLPFFLSHIFLPRNQTPDST